MESKKLRGNPLYQYLSAASGTLTIITSGMHYGWPSPSLPQMFSPNSTIRTSNDQGSWLAVMPLLGSVSGVFISGMLVDFLGRKRTILLTSIPYFSSWIMVAFSDSVLVYCIARFIAGLADIWAFTSIPMYMGEIAEPKIRGMLGSSVSVTWLFGILLVNIIGTYLSIRATALVASVLPVIAFLTFIWMPESPYCLLMKKYTTDAKKSLQIFRGLQDVDYELHRLTIAVDNQMRNTGKFWDLFTIRSNRRALLVMMGLRATQQLSGTTAITFYTQPIFKETGNALLPELATITYFSVQVVVACICSVLVDRVGRRPLLKMSITGSAIFLLIEGIYFYIKSRTELNVTRFSWIPVASLIGFVIIFTLGMQVIPILMLGELFPANIKGFALSFAGLYYCVLATIVSKFFQIMKDSLGMHMPFFIFSGCCLLGLICIELFVPETKGKTLEQIQMYFRSETELEENNLPIHLKDVNGTAH